MKTVGYIRVSTEDQASNGVSLAVQRDKLAAYAGLYGLDLVDIVEDAGESAKTLRRPGLQRALAMLRDGSADALLVMKLDRLTRSVRDLGTLIETTFNAETGKPALLSVQDQVDTRTAAGRLVLNVLVSVSQWEREAISERTTAALAHKRAAGKVYGVTPFGFDRVGDDLVPNEDEQGTIKKIQSLRIEGKTLAAIAAHLNEAGATTKRRATWNPCQVQRVLERAG
jgi:site-specific DNA recombinase